jgi:hypothetical protein
MPGPLEILLTSLYPNTKHPSTCPMLHPPTPPQGGVSRNQHHADSSGPRTILQEIRMRRSYKRSRRTTYITLNSHGGLPKPHQNLLVYLHLHGNSDRLPGNAPLQPNIILRKSIPQIGYRESPKAFLRIAMM